MRPRTHRLLRDFSRKYGLHLFDQQGVCHQLMLEIIAHHGLIPHLVAEEKGERLQIILLKRFQEDRINLL